eukprot:s1649_g7.t1
MPGCVEVSVGEERPSCLSLGSLVHSGLEWCSKLSIGEQVQAADQQQMDPKEVGCWHSRDLGPCLSYEGDSRETPLVTFELKHCTYYTQQTSRTLMHLAASVCCRYLCAS